MDSTVSTFFTKTPTEDYCTLYRLDHSPRIKALLDRYGLAESLKGKRVADFGGGLGFLGELLDPSTNYWVIDGAEIAPEKRLCKGTWRTTDLDYDNYQYPRSYESEGLMTTGYEAPPLFDVAFFLETIEHLGNPHHALVEIKRLVKPDGLIYISTPTETVWHNTPYPSLLWPPQNFAQFLGQMALPVTDFYLYEPKERGWPAYQYQCVNKPWAEKRLAFPKDDPKFRDCTPLQATNL